MECSLPFRRRSTTAIGCDLRAAEERVRTMGEGSAGRLRRARIERRSGADGRRRERSGDRRGAGSDPREPRRSSPAPDASPRGDGRAPRSGPQRSGPTAVLVRTPGFFKSQMTNDVFVRHYTAVADASPVPMLLYNFTAVTGVNLLPAAVSPARRRTRTSSG